MTGTTTTKKMFGLAAATAGAAGLLAVPIPVSAMPPFRLAPTCVAWRLDDASQAFDTASGGQIYVPWSSGTPNVRTGNSDAAFVSPDVNMKGSATGGIDGAGVVDVTVRWNDGKPFNADTPWIHFHGNVNDLGALSGNSNDSKGVSQPFTARTPYTCNTKQDTAPGAGNPGDVPAAAPVTNAITPNFDGSSNTTFKVTVKNSSKLPASCNYEAVSQNPLLPSDTTRTFDVPPNASHTESFDGVKTGTNYTITINCTDSSGSQTEPLGSVNQTVKW